MKYTIVINQKKALELGLSFDEAVLITCVHDLLPLASFQKNENSEVWITHTKFLSEYPMLKIGRTTLYNRLKKLVDKNLLTKSEKIAQAKKMNFYGLTPKSELLFTDSHVQNLNFTCSESELVHVQNLDFTCSESEHNKYTNYPNTNNQDTIINKNLIKENSSLISQAEKILKYLELKTGETFRPTKANLTNIKGRLNDGYSIDECKRVIDNMYLEWHGETAMIEGKLHNCDDWLNPTTLFKPTKFDNRLNKKPRELTTKDLAKTMTFEEPPEGFVF